MRKVFISAVALLLAGSVAVAQSPEPSGQERTEAKPSFAFLQLDSVVQPGEVAAAGDIISVTRQFPNWLLRCTVRPSIDKRVCSVEQARSADGGALVWRIAPNVQKETVSLFALPTTFDADRGLQLRFDDFSKEITRGSFLCNDEACIAGIPFDGVVAKAMMEAKSVNFAWFEKGTGKQIVIEMPLHGLSDAAGAAANDPFGRDISYRVAAEKKKLAKQAKGKKPAEAKKTKDK